MKKIEIIENTKIPVKIKIDGKIVDLELKLHEWNNEDHSWDECICPFKDICYLGGDDANDDKKHIDIRLGKFSGNYGEQNIGWLCDNLANAFNNNIETLRPTYESMIKLNDELGLVKIKDRRHVLSPDDERLKSTKQESKEDKYKSVILL